MHFTWLDNQTKFQHLHEYSTLIGQSLHSTGAKLWTNVESCLIFNNILIKVSYTSFMECYFLKCFSWTFFFFNVTCFGMHREHFEGTFLWCFQNDKTECFLNVCVTKGKNIYSLHLKHFKNSTFWTENSDFFHNLMGTLAKNPWHEIFFLNWFPGCQVFQLTGNVLKTFWIMNKYTSSNVNIIKTCSKLSGL